MSNFILEAGLGASLQGWEGVCLKVLGQGGVQRPLSEKKDMFNGKGRGYPFLGFSSVYNLTCHVCFWGPSYQNHIT